MLASYFKAARMRVLVTGGRGQLGSELAFVAREFAGLEFVFTDRAELDVCDERAVFAAVCGGVVGAADLRAGAENGAENGADFGATDGANSNLVAQNGKNVPNSNSNETLGENLAQNSNLSEKSGANFTANLNSSGDAGGANSNLDEKRGKNGENNFNLIAQNGGKNGADFGASVAQNGANLTSNSNLGENGGENIDGKTTAQNAADKIQPAPKTAPNAAPKTAPRPFDAVINCAAYTAVDRAEGDEPAAFALNATAAANLARACKAAGARLVHISTDYVFDGTAHRPLAECDPVAPLGVYGRSKLAGERAVLGAHLAHSCIIRTSWLYSEFGGNFVKTIARAARARDRLAVVADQIGTPTNARDLARAICAILPQLDGVGGTEVLHYSGEGAASWYDFACEVVRLVGRSGACAVAAISSAEFLAQNAGRAIAPRPFYSVLDKGKIKARFGLEIPHWLASLRGADIAAWEI